jgi:signal peptide peptidase SppA
MRTEVFSLGDRYRHLVAAILNRPWMIDPASEAWAAMLEILELRSDGLRLTEEEIQARIDAASRGPRAGTQTAGAVAIVPLYGLIAPRANLMTAMSGGTTAEGFVRSFKAAVADPDVTGILLDVDSPGGNVLGIDEAATVVREARGQKPIVAIANHTAASAAYYIACQADELVVTPSGSVGSIGVIGMHVEFSEAERLAGERWTVISYGKYKAEGNSHEPLSEDAQANMQAQADAYGAMFVAAVAKGRGSRRRRSGPTSARAGCSWRRPPSPRGWPTASTPSRTPSGASARGR